MGHRIAKASIGALKGAARLAFLMAALLGVWVLVGLTAKPLSWAQHEFGRGKPGAGKGTLSPLRIDPNGPTDPYIVFDGWRRKNHVTIMTPPFVDQSHRIWLKHHRAPSGQRLKAPLSRQSNVKRVDPPGGITVLSNVDLGPVPKMQTEVAIAVNPNNPYQVVAAANTSNQDANCLAPDKSAVPTLALYGSTDGGFTWKYNCAPWPPDAVPRSATFPWDSFLEGSDPSVAWGNDGNAYASYLLVGAVKDGLGGRILTSSVVVAKSPDVGRSWSPWGTVANDLDDGSGNQSGYSGQFDDKEMIAVDTTSAHPNRVYVIWTRAINEQAAYSDDGLNWHRATVDPIPEFYPEVATGGDLAIGPDGTIYAVWNRVVLSEGEQCQEFTLFAKSNDGGNNWLGSGSPHVADHNLLSFRNNTIPPQDLRGVNAFPAIAVDPSGNLYVVYADRPPQPPPSPSCSLGWSSQATDIYLTRSTDGGTTWSKPLTVNDDTGGAFHFFPWVAADPTNGDVVVSWYDTRNDAGQQNPCTMTFGCPPSPPQNRKTQIFIAVSTDGGQSFSANQKVTGVVGGFTNLVDYSDLNSLDNSHLGQSPAGNYDQYGDYAQVTVYGSRAYAIWTDSRMFFPADGTNAYAEEAAAARVCWAGDPECPINDLSKIPPSAAAKSGVLTITSNARDGVQRVTLSAKGTEAKPKGN